VKVAKRTSTRPAATKATRKAATKQVPARKAVTRNLAPAAVAPADDQAIPATRGRAGAAPRGRGAARRATKPRHITPEQALANTRDLLEAKQARDREPPPWRQFDPDHGHPAHEHAIPGRDSTQAAQAHAHAEELHRAESRMKAIQGSISGQDRRHQGRQDAKG
jgi:hypothetical protein